MSSLSRRPSRARSRSYLDRFNANPQMHCSKCRDLASTEELNYRSDSDRYAELRKLVEDCQREAMDSASTVVMFDNALRLVLDWRHR